MYSDSDTDSDMLDMDPNYSYYEESDSDTGENDEEMRILENIIRNSTKMEIQDAVLHPP